ncbi:cytochrome P450 315a1, mitochondrial [Anopheles ziemanni]|uniref:cytochrome P450 315a1, mitochondrial n=1 Tax=Anopheles coustani TaxID=139045 RepID=UPI00265B1DBD|nr:cytochrome P450 315a1, mitochondrial [Anopheles coustani]XP_058176022.1 cytochrome P450 315a1, mitochondrial [Anopheles ziemanni]
MFPKRKIIPKLLQLTYQQSTNISTNNVPFLKIPGPRRIPLIGMLNEVMHLGKPAELHLRISKYHDTYGDIFRLQIGQQHTVFVRDPGFMRKTFQLEGPFPRHPLPESWTYFNKKFNFQRGLFFMDGQEWVQARQIFNKPLLKDFTWMEPSIQAVCESKVNEIKSTCDKDAAFENIESFLYRWSVEVVLSVMLGKSFQMCQTSVVFQELIQQFSHVVYEIFQHTSELMNIPPAIADKLNVQAWQQFEKVVPETIRLATEIIEFGIQYKNTNSGLLDIMSEKLEKSLMMRIFIDFIVAAGDTTAFATVWALHLLASNRDVQQQVRRDVQDSNSLECTAIKGVVRETLRLFPVAPFIGRFIENDAVFGEYNVPKDTLVLLSLYSSGRDGRFFSDPERFNPYRWDRTNAQNSPNSTTASASLPFAIGARSCIGQKIAQLQMHYLLSMILKKFDLLIPEQHQHQQIKPILKMITVPNMSVKVAFNSI